MRSCHLQLLLLLLLTLLFLLSLYSVSTTHAANNNNTTVEVVLFRPQQSILTLDPITYVDIHGNVIVSDESCTYFFFELSGPEGEVSLKAYYDLPWNATTDEDDDHPHGKLSIYTMVGNYTYENHTGNSTVIESEENADNTRRPSSVRGYQLRSVDIINIPRRQQSIQSFAAILNFQHSIPNAIKTRYSVGVCSNDPLEPNGTPFEISLEFYCGGSTYTSSSYDGDFICQLCPQHSRRLNPFSRFLTTSHGANSTGAPNYSAKDCICEDGYYLNTNISNDTCLECPQGSLCSGTTNAPIIAAGYYPYIVDEAFDSDTSTHMIARDHNTSTVLVKCPYPEACIGEADTRSSSSSSSSQKNGVSDSSSSSSSVCAAGYTGFVCNTCDDDHFRLGQKCRRCDEKAARPVRFVFYLIAILLFWSLIYPLSSFYTYIGSPSILINFIQITALFAGFNLDWPTYLLDIFSFMSLANWNIEVTGPECMTKGFTFYVRYAFMLAIPVLYASMAALNLLIVALVNLLVRVIEKKRKTKGTGATCGALCGQVPRLFHIKSFAQWTNSAMVTFVLISWVFVSQWSLEFFSCDIFPSSVARVTGIPSVHTRDSSMVCQRGLFSRWSVFASIAMIIYVVILPILLAAFVITIFIIRKKSGRSLAGECPPDVKISDLSPALNETRAGWIYLYGPLYARFKPKYFWWETVITFRKLGIVVCAAYLLREPAFGALLSSTVLIICATAHIVIMPYKHMSSNVLEAILLFLQIAMIICGVCFYAADFDAYDTVLATFVILFVSLGFLIGVGVLIFELVRYWGTEKIIVEECETNQILLNSEPRVHESRLTKDTTIPAASPPRGAPSAPPASEISLAPPPPPPPLSISTPPPPPAMPLSNNCAGGLPPPPPPPPQGLKPDYALYRPSYEY